MKIIILLGKKFIFKAAGIESLIMNSFKNFLKHQFILDGYVADNSGKSWRNFTEIQGW